MTTPVGDPKPQQLLEWLECPVCFETPRTGPIYGCKNGHLICKDCQPKVAECPTCREREISCRNLFAEKVLENALKDCKFSSQGCLFKDLLSNVETHEQLECNYRTVKCVRRSCDWKGPLTELVQHVITNECATVPSRLSGSTRQLPESHSQLREAHSQHREAHSRLREAHSQHREAHSQLRELVSESELSRIRFRFRESHSQLPEAHSQHRELVSELRELYSWLVAHSNESHSQHLELVSELLECISQLLASYSQLRASYSQHRE